MFFLVPHNIKMPLFFWTRDGDFVLLIILILGLLFSIKLIRLFSERRSAYCWFVGGLCFAIIAILMDSFNYEGFGIDIQLIEQFIEELFEVSGMLSIFSAVFLMFNFYLQNFLSARD
ncbi:hypothetical protein [Desulfofundulus luciae]|nr:hypothetical protein [Desulfofundulus luciae]